MPDSETRLKIAYVVEDIGPALKALLAASAARHSHLCPRQVLGVRIGLAGVASLGVDVTQKKKNLLVIVESDGCFTTGVEIATGASVGHRTLRVADYGKIAATFVHVDTGAAVRVAPRPRVRELARRYAPRERRRYFAMLAGYQRMPDEALLSLQPVQLTTPVAALISRQGARAVCALCGEEIINEREVLHQGQTVCQACAGYGYYKAC